MNEQEEIEKKRTKCEVWSRCMGYHRPVSNYNTWKKSEFYWRTNFKEEKTFNSKFVEIYI